MLGAIDRVMDGSFIKEVLETVHNNNTVSLLNGMGVHMWGYFIKYGIMQDDSECNELVN